VTEIMAMPVFVSKAGPFAWNGSISFWMGVVVFGFWLCCVIVFLMKATDRQSVDEPPLD
jgi:Ca2+/Na+ antiporter